mgnify:CR=1 FL=1
MLIDDPVELISNVPTMKVVFFPIYRIAFTCKWKEKELLTTLSDDVSSKITESVFANTTAKTVVVGFANEERHEFGGVI